MKNLVFNFVLAIAAVFGMQTTYAQNTPVIASGAELSINKEIHDYGTLEQYGDTNCEFIVTNTGTSPLIISRCKGSCGCTVPKCDKQPILPGKSTSIKVEYDNSRIGVINKSVTIYSNADNSPTKVIRIKGIIKAAASGTPLKNKPKSAPVAN